MEEKVSQAQLLELLKAGQPVELTTVDVSTVRYALYARKSSVDESKQTSSVEDQIRNSIEELSAQRSASKDTLLTFDNYLKLFSSIPDVLSKTQDMVVMDSLMRILFSNFTVTAEGSRFSQGSKVSYKLKEPWKGFVSANDFVSGAT